MEAICTEGKFFTAEDTTGFSNAVNDAVYYALKHHVITWEIHPDFTLDESSLAASENTAVKVETVDGQTVLNWTLDTSYATHTLNYQLRLNRKNGAYPSGTLDVNSGDAVLSINGSEEVKSTAVSFYPHTGRPGHRPY